ncbi:hypothetical protein BD289DRAFT_456852 [Coniella lustricola]|uniref:Uncharacterized protein n=1 Tax=Coniella lustricola TaxID=2025994 RepID=A0A2T2ZUA5_9PEZI|nr:hypothetical protein BD289DRAFT_456852 [Coniella lustricola]
MASLEIDTALRRYNTHDFETASVRSAAPSYVSEAPSYHTTISNGEAIPPYSPPTSNINNNASSTSTLSNDHATTTASDPAAVPAPTPVTVRTSSSQSLPTLLPSNTAHIPTPGLPPIPPAPTSSNSGMPAIGAWAIPSWSTVNTNPTYQRVASRRAQAAMSSGEGLLRNAARVLDRVNEESNGSGADTPPESERIRPLEDPHLVGEDAARRARNARLARENDDILQLEDRRWDWFLAQQRDWDERERSWKQFRRTMSSTSSMSRGRIVRRFTAGMR